MNPQQFRFVRETIRRDFNLTEAARMLYTSQPGVSKAIIEFEDELGIKIFERHGKRIKADQARFGGVAGDRPHHARSRQPEEGQRRVRASRRGRVGDRLHPHPGALSAAARDPGLPQAIPKVHLSLAEGSPAQLAEMVLHEQADLALATESLALTPGLATLPVYAWGAHGGGASRPSADRADLQRRQAPVAGAAGRVPHRHL